MDRLWLEGDPLLLTLVLLLVLFAMAGLVQDLDTYKKELLESA